MATAFSDAISAFVDYKVYRRGSTESTRVTYNSILNDFLSHISCEEVEAITLDCIDSYIENAAKSGYKPKTVKNKAVVIRSFIKWAYAKKLTDIRPESIELPRVQDIEANFLDYDEQEALLEAVECPRDYALVSLLLSSGLRASEASDVRTDDIFERSVIVRCGKGRKPRVTFITPECELAIEAYLKTKKKTHYLLTNRSGDKLSRQYIHRVVHNAAVKAGIEKNVSPHTLRHSFCTNLLRNGARAEDVQPMVGHVNIATTRLYMHFTNDYLHDRYDEFSKRKKYARIDKEKGRTWE